MRSERCREVPILQAASFTGFKTWTVDRVELAAGQLLRLTPTLEIGEVTEKVTAEATAELIQTEKGSVKSTIEQKQILDLPLNGRNPVELVRLTPGMRYLGQQGGFEREPSFKAWAAETMAPSSS